MSATEGITPTKLPLAKGTVASFVLAITGALTMILFIGLFLSLASFILGLVTIARNRKYATVWKGRGLAIAAVVISGLSLAVGIPFWIVVFPIAMSA